MIRRLLILIILCAAVAPTAAAFDAARAREILNGLASDAFQGRRPGHPGGVKTEEYLAENLRICRVEPGGRAGYFQEVPMLVTEEQSVDMTLMDHELGKIPFTLGVDFTPIVHSGSGTVIAPVVIAGFGYIRPEQGRDDYAGVDVRGKIVLILRGYPDSPWDYRRDYERRQLLTWAKEKRAAAVLFYQQAYPLQGAAIPADLYDPNLPLLYVGDRLLKLLLDGSGYSADTYKSALRNNPLPIETNKRVYINVSSRKSARQSARNVLGIVYGTDPVLRNEIIVVGGHWDHVGTDARGVVYNGADDNASGTALVAELARAFAEHPLKRSVLFIHFTGEEDGLLGSDYFVNHPTIPFGNIVGMVNLDCEGMGTGEIIMAGGETFGPIWSDYATSLDSTARSTLKFYREDGYGAGDHASFMNAGCPSLAFWSRGQHPFYHSYEDDARWISDAVFAAIGQRAEHFVRYLGNREGALAFHADTSRLLARLAVSVDFKGYPIDAAGSVQPPSCVTGAWLPRDAMTVPVEAVRRMSELHSSCETKQIVFASFKDAFAADERQQKAIFAGASDGDLMTRRAADMTMLMRQGLSAVRLTSMTSNVDRGALPEALETLRKSGLMALIPFDFSAAARVDRWKSQAIVTGELADFAGAPETIRNGLAQSDALLVLNAGESPTADQLRSVIPGVKRRIHLNFGSIPDYRREEHAKVVIKQMFDAGFSRDDILRLISGNLRRFMES